MTERFAVYLTREERDTVARLADLARSQTKSPDKAREDAHKALLEGIRLKANNAADESQNGWANRETWLVRLFLGGDYGAEYAGAYEEAREGAQGATAGAFRGDGSQQWASETPEAYRARRERVERKAAGEAAKEFLTNYLDTAGPCEGFRADLIETPLNRVDWEAIGAYLLED